MVLDHLLNARSHARLATSVDSLLSDKSLPKPVRNYLISCKVEGKSPRTVEVYYMVLSRLSKIFSFSVSPTAQDIRLFILSLQNSNLKPATVHIYYRSLKTFFNWLVNEGLLDKNPMANIRPPKLPRLVIMPYTVQDIANLLKLCSGHSFMDIRNRAIFLMFLDTGVRLEEMSGVAMDDIDFDAETIRIMGKGRKGRMVRIGIETQKAMLKYAILRRDDDFKAFWLTEEHRPLSREGVKVLVRRYCHAAVVSGARASAHTFRHTCAINCLRNGMSVFELQIMLGHSSLEMTRRYVSTLGAEDMLKAHRKASPVDNFLK
ncbi:MAG: tyrosine-type recombinase/integrase [Dehalococcoidales bacterium]|nr:tyrosine-type recombinase/integrase [Dehalococcoidales bacterium]